MKRKFRKLIRIILRVIILIPKLIDDFALHNETASIKTILNWIILKNDPNAYKD